MNTEVTPTRNCYGYFQPISTRWMDNDLYGHINNVQYYSFFDTIVNHFLITVGGLDIHRASIIGVAIESHCNYRQPLAYPQTLDAGLRVEAIGNTSVRYGVGIFGQEIEQAAAWGHFVHVFVDRDRMKKVPIPESLRLALGQLVRED